MAELKKNFMKHHEEGKTIKEIAELYNVSIRHIYTSLQDIADENNVSRESLLTNVHKKHKPLQNTKSAGQINPAEMKENFDGIINNAKIIIKKIDSILQEEIK
jgi:predicted DNA-binding protein YlxM (UPF0122 family)